MTSAASVPSLRMLFIGDVIGRAGRAAVARYVPQLRAVWALDFVIVNGENAAGGFGITEAICDEFLSAGADCVTLGNHAFDQREALVFIERQPRLLRPVNYPPGTPGRGSTVVETPAGIKVGVLNLEGRVYMKNLDCPFRCADAELELLRKQTSIILLDFHAETTSEKASLGWYLDGRVSAVVGTHTHVQTADERILPNGTAYITDVGMTGSFDSVIGVDKGQAIQRFLTQQSVKFDIPKKDLRINAVVIGIDTKTGKAVSIERINAAC